MGHGNISDLVALTLIGSSVASIFYTETLFQDIAIFKGSTKSPEAEAMAQLNGGLLLVIALMLSAVKWNPANGKMAGMGMFLSVFNMIRVTLSLDQGAFIPRFVYVNAFALALGGLHVFVFPSNAKPAKTEKTKNNHGNFSDIVALVLLAASVVCVWYPSLLLQDFGPIKAQFATSSSDLEGQIKIAGGLICAIALTFSSVKWNPANGKMSGLGCFLFAANIGWYTFKHMDKEAFILRPFYLFAVVIFLAGFNVFLFPSNPIPPKADQKKDN